MGYSYLMPYLFPNKVDGKMYHSKEYLLESYPWAPQPSEALLRKQLSTQSISCCFYWYISIYWVINKMLFSTSFVRWPKKTPYEKSMNWRQELSGRNNHGGKVNDMIWSCNLFVLIRQLHIQLSLEQHRVRCMNPPPHTHSQKPMYNFWLLKTLTS